MWKRVSFFPSLSSCDVVGWSNRCFVFFCVKIFHSIERLFTYLFIHIERHLYGFPLAAFKTTRSESYICNKILFNLGRKNNFEISLGMFSVTVTQSEVCRCLCAKTERLCFLMLIIFNLFLAYQEASRSRIAAR